MRQVFENIGARAQTPAMQFALAGLALACLAFPAAAADPPADAHVLLLNPARQVTGWGSNDFGQVQPGQADLLPAPRTIAFAKFKPLAVATAGRHSLALDDSGKVWAWGDNSGGQLGTGDTRPLTGTVRAVALPARATIVAAGMQHSAALLADGTIWTWGTNDQGQLGRGSAKPFDVQASPRQVEGLPPAADVAAGDNFVMVLSGLRNKGALQDGKIWFWGAGDGAVRALSGVTQPTVVRAAGNIAMARDAKGGFWRWQVNGSRLAAPSASSLQAFQQLGQPLELLQPPASPLPATPQAGSAAPATSGAKSQAAAALPPVPAAPLSTPALAPNPRPASPLATAPQPASTVPPVAPTPTSPAAPVNVLPALVHMTGVTRLSSGFGSAGSPLEGARVTGDGAQCTTTDAQGRYACTAPSGWSGRLSVSRNNYRFSPSSLSFQNLRVDAVQQDFSATYDPR